MGGQFHHDPVHDPAGGRSSAEASPEAAERLGALMRARLTEDGTPARKAWLGAIVGRIEVDQGIIGMMGRKDMLEQAVATRGALAPSGRGGVPRWRAQEDSNL